MRENPTKDYVNVALEEYRTLREEVKQSNVNQFQSLSFGSAAVSVLLSAGFYASDKIPLTTVIVFSLFVPLLSFFSTFLWLGEIARMVRAGNFIVFIEKKIETIVEIPPGLSAKQEGFDPGGNATAPLSWERYLRDKRDTGAIQGHMVWVHKVRLWIFPVVALISWGMGGFYLFSRLVINDIAFSAYVVASYFIVLFIWICMVFKVARVFREVTKRYWESDVQGGERHVAKS